MLAYIIRRVLLIIPTLFAIMVINFAVIQAAPGGPIEQMISQIKGTGVGATERVSGQGGETSGGQAQRGGGETSSRYRGARGLPPEFIKDLERMYGFDKPPLERFLQMMGNYLRFDFGNSFFRDRRVVDLVIER